MVIIMDSFVSRDLVGLYYAGIVQKYVILISYVAMYPIYRVLIDIEAQL